MASGLTTVIVGSASSVATRSLRSGHILIQPWSLGSSRRTRFPKRPERRETQSISRHSCEIIFHFDDASKFALAAAAESGGAHPIVKEVTCELTLFPEPCSATTRFPTILQKAA